MKGQTAIESLFVLIVVISAAIFIGVQYMDTHDVTIATTIARNELTAIANSKSEMVLIESIVVTRNDREAIVDVRTKPNTIDPNFFGDVSSIKTKITDNTSFSSSKIFINGTETI